MSVQASASKRKCRPQSKNPAQWPGWCCCVLVRSVALRHLADKVFQYRVGIVAHILVNQIAQHRFGFVLALAAKHAQAVAQIVAARAHLRDVVA